MLPFDLRLRKPQEFERVRLEGKTWRDHTLKINVAENGSLNNRFGFIVSRRVGNAVTRNRVKRQLRTGVAKILPHLKRGYDIIIITSPATATLTYHELEASLGKLFRLACLL